MKSVTITILLLFTSLNLFSQVDKSSDLFKAILKQDSLLFNIGYNTCDIHQFENIISDSFEFYHDQAGIINSKADFITSVKNNICKLSYKPIRRLVEGSMQVFPLMKKGVLYGAIQTGKHSFFALEKDKPEYFTSTAQFTNVWLLEKGEWKLSRCLSYDHQDKEDSVNEKLLFKDKAETEKWMVKKHIPVLGIGYIEDGKIKEAKVYGELEKGRPAPDNAIFNVASLTKPITALVTLKLVNEGKWDLDKPLYEYWIDPDIANDPRAKKLTTRHILSHQTGFPNWRYKNADGKLAFEFDPGTKYQYSGEGFEYLRRALEKKFGKTLDQLASELIFKPLGMYDTRYYWDSTRKESRFAKWHDGKGNLYETYKNSSANAADDLLTTVGDYCKFMIHIMNGAGLSKELYGQMISNQVRTKKNQYFGLGWLVDENIGKGESAITHGGDDKGVHTIVFMLPKSKQGLLIFTNCDNGVDIYIPTILVYLGELGQGIIDVETK